MSEVSYDPLELELQPLFMSPPFAHLHKCQPWLVARRYDSEELAQETGQAYADKLNELAAESDVLGQPVILSGPNLVFKRKNIPADSPDQPTYEPYPIPATMAEGNFNGFNYLIHKTTVNKADEYRIKLGYQALLHGAGSTDSWEATYVWGPAFDTALDFTADIQAGTTFCAVQEFVSDGDSEKQQLMSQIRQFVIAQTVSGADVSQAARAINTYLADSHGQVSEAAKAALLLLMRAKLQLYAPRVFAVDVPSCLERPEAHVQHSIVAGIRGHAVVSDIVYGPNVLSHNAQLTEIPAALYASSRVAGNVEGTSRTLLLPLDAIKVLRPS